MNAASEGGTPGSIEAGPNPSLVGLLAARGEEAATPTEGEARNLEVIRALRRASFDERPTFSLLDVRPHRHGLHTLSHRARVRGAVGYDRDSVTDRRDDILDMIAKGDRVWAVWRVAAVHTGELLGFAPTGEPVSFLELGIWRLEDGKVAESWYFADEFELLEQLQAHAAFAGSKEQP